MERLVLNYSFILLLIIFSFDCSSIKQSIYLSKFKVVRKYADTLFVKSDSILCDVIHSPSKNNPILSILFKQKHSFYINNNEIRKYYSKDSLITIDSTVLVSRIRSEYFQSISLFKKIVIRVAAHEKTYSLGSTNKLSLNLINDFGIKQSQVICLQSIEFRPSTMDTSNWRLVSLKKPSPNIVEQINKINIKAVEQCLEEGTDPNSCDQDGTPAIIFSSGNSNREGSQEIVKLLLTYGADPDITTEFDKCTALMRACRISGNTKVIRVLLSANANVDAKDINGCTALLMATKAENIEAIKLLLKNKADQCSVDLAGNTPLGVASEYPQKTIFDLLTKPLRAYHILGFRGFDYALGVEDFSAIDWLFGDYNLLLRGIDAGVIIRISAGIICYLERYTYTQGHFPVFKIRMRNGRSVWVHAEALENNPRIKWDYW